MKKEDPNRYPKGWNRRKVEAVIRHYERQTEEEAIAEAATACRNQKTTMMQIPVKLVPAVQKLVAKRAG